MWTVLKLSPRAIAAIAGWKPGTITAMLETYGHADVGAFEEVDAAFAHFKRPICHTTRRAPERAPAGTGLAVNGRKVGNQHMTY